jgi:hypothetical protein
VAQRSIARASNLERSLDLSRVTAFVLAEEEEPLIEIELAECVMSLLDLGEGEPAR